MKIELRDSFLEKLNRQVDFIAADKPKAARKFKNDVLQRIKNLSDQPFKYRKSIYSDDESVRDMIFKGYTVVYKIDQNQKLISVFAFIKHEKRVRTIRRK